MAAKLTPSRKAALGAAAKGKAAPNALSPQKRAAIEKTLRSTDQPQQNEIARKHSVSPSTVGKIAKAIGVSFDRSRTERATETRKVDAQAKAVSLTERLLDEAALLVDTLHKPYLVFNFGGRDNEYNEHTLEEPPVEVVRQVFTVAAIAIDKQMKISDRSRGAGGDGSVFDALVAIIGGADAAYDEPSMADMGEDESEAGGDGD